MSNEIKKKRYIVIVKERGIEVRRVIIKAHKAIQAIDQVLAFPSPSQEVIARAIK